MFVPANIFQPLIDVFETVLKFFHNGVGVPWGFSIVLLTVVIRALLLPLTLKQFKSMRALQGLQPELKAIQNRYKEDKQRQQQELMKFYKENNVNPLGSCLPLVAQLPVFVSLFYMLRQSLRGDICPRVQLAFQHLHGLAASHTTPCGVGHGAGFLFIGDLTNKATGITLVVLIALYVGTQLGSSLLMSTPTMDSTQRKLMLLMPLFFVVFFIQYPAGLLVYWVTTNTWTILQQYVVRRRMGPVMPLPQVADAGAAAGGSSASGGGSSSGGRGGPNGSGGSDRNGAGGSGGSNGGLAGLLRGRMKPAQAPVAVGAGAGRRGVPPPPPRKKKKRSGRKR
ncbi:MAG: YidC/Oxa1 family membrane protein insertase [Solirubrobacteraceae bacterium]